LRRAVFFQVEKKYFRKSILGKKLPPDQRSHHGSTKGKSGDRITSDFYEYSISLSSTDIKRFFGEKLVRSEKIFLMDQHHFNIEKRGIFLVKS